jgi:hypothetical protein
MIIMIGLKPNFTDLLALSFWIYDTVHNFLTFLKQNVCQLLTSTRQSFDKSHNITALLLKTFFENS